MPPQEKTTARASRFPHHKSRSAFAFLMTALLLGLPSAARADGPAFVQKGGVFGRVVQVDSNYLVEWYNTTQHKLKVSFSLTLEDNRSRELTTAIESKQRLQDPVTKSSAKITQVKITRIVIDD